jgi:hypothetical protein
VCPVLDISAVFAGPEYCNSTLNGGEKTVKNRVLATALSLLYFACPAFGQHGHPKVRFNLIDGMKTPELIPDPKAYRQYLIDMSVPANATPKQLEVQTAFLGNSGLTDGGQELFKSDLATFRSQFDYLVASYNRKATMADAAGVPADAAFFNQQIDDLVAQTRTNLARDLLPIDKAAFDARAHEYKTHIRWYISANPSAKEPTKNGGRLVVVAQEEQIGPCTIYLDYTVSSGFSLTQTAKGSGVYDYKVTAAATTSGSASMSGCTIGVNGTHQPAAQVSFVPVAGCNGCGIDYTAGTAACVSCYITVTASTTEDVGDDPWGDLFDFYSEGNVYCSVVGEDVFNDGSFPLQVETAYARAAYTGSVSNCTTAKDGTVLCTISTTPWCTPQTTPPDLFVTSINSVAQPPSGFYDNLAACIRTGPGAKWACFGIISVDYILKEPAPLASCTYNP